MAIWLSVVDGLHERGATVLKTELAQAELAVIEAGIALAKLKVKAVETQIEEVKTNLESAKVDGRMTAQLLRIEAEAQAIKEHILMIEEKVRLFHFGDDQASSKAPEKASALRAHIEIDNDKLCVIERELNLIDRDIRDPRFTVAVTQ